MSASHPSTSATRGPSQVWAYCTVPEVSGYARYSRPSAPIVLLDSRLALGGVGVTRTSAGRAVGVARLRGEGGGWSPTGAVGTGATEGGVAADRVVGRPGVSEVVGAQAATRTEPAVARPACMTARRVRLDAICIASPVDLSAGVLP